MNFSELFQLASVEAASDEPQGKEKDIYIKWIKKHLEFMTSKNDYVWSYRIVSEDELQQVDVGTSGFAYAYLMPSEVSDVKAVNPGLEATYVPNIKYALDRNIPFDINQFIPGAEVGTTEVAFQFTGNTLYSSCPVSTVIGKKKFQDLSQVPVTVQEMFIKYIASMMARRSSGGNDARELMFDAKTLETSIATRALKPENTEQQIISRYLKKTYTLLTSI